jgi:hypothetical protein
LKLLCGYLTENRLDNECTPVEDDARKGLVQTTPWARLRTVERGCTGRLQEGLQYAEGFDALEKEERKVLQRKFAKEIMALVRDTIIV